MVLWMFRDNGQGMLFDDDAKRIILDHTGYSEEYWNCCMVAVIGTEGRFDGEA